MQEMEPNFQFEWVETGDGSPSIRLWKADQAPECMHHSGGALSESLYIYGDAFEEALRYIPRGRPLRVLSLGLGLGYNEMIATALAFREMRLDELQIDSFESEDFLSRSLQNWLDQQVGEEAWFKVYDQIIQMLSSKLNISGDELKQALAKIKMEDRWRIHGGINIKTEFSAPYSCLFFDAFSSGATPELWSEDFLTQFLKRASSDTCILSTYAATGNLKRALKNSGFEVKLRDGYANKRHSTWAVKIDRHSHFRQP